MKNYSQIIIVATESVSLCVCVFVCVFVCVCVCVRNINLEYIVVYEKSSDEFDIEHCRIKVKVTVGFQLFPNYQLSAPRIPLWYKLGSMYVYLILIYKINEYYHALFS